MAKTPGKRKVKRRDCARKNEKLFWFLFFFLYHFLLKLIFKVQGLGFLSVLLFIDYLSLKTSARRLITVIMKPSP